MFYACERRKKRNPRKKHFGHTADPAFVPEPHEPDGGIPLPDTILPRREKKAKNAK
jgi:hypothetical protein